MKDIVIRLSRLPTEAQYHIMETYGKTKRFGNTPMSNSVEFNVYQISMEIDGVISDKYNPVVFPENSELAFKFTPKPGYSLPMAVTVLGAQRVSWDKDTGILIVKNPTKDVRILVGYVEFKDFTFLSVGTVLTMEVDNAVNGGFKELISIDTDMILSLSTARIFGANIDTDVTHDVHMLESEVSEIAMRIKELATIQFEADAYPTLLLWETLIASFSMQLSISMANNTLFGMNNEISHIMETSIETIYSEFFRIILEAQNTITEDIELINAVIGTFSEKVIHTLEVSPELSRAYPATCKVVLEHDLDTIFSAEFVSLITSKLKLESSVNLQVNDETPREINAHIDPKLIINPIFETIYASFISAIIHEFLMISVSVDTEPAISFAKTTWLKVSHSTEFYEANTQTFSLLSKISLTYYFFLEDVAAIVFKYKINPMYALDFVLKLYEYIALGYKLQLSNNHDAIIELENTVFVYIRENISHDLIPDIESEIVNHIHIHLFEVFNVLFSITIGRDAVVADEYDKTMDYRPAEEISDFYIYYL